MKRSLWRFAAVALFLALAAGGCRAAAPTPALPSQPVPAPREAGMEYSPQADLQAVAAATTTERRVVRTASLDLIVRDTRRALREIEQLAKDLEGYITSLNTYQYEQGETASVTLRVPADKLDLALERLRGLATTVRRESVSGEDVTEEFVDLESRLRHLEAKEKQLLEFLEKAEDTEAVLAVYEHLSQTQAEIEQVKGRMRYLENQVALATITVTLTPDVMAQPLDATGWNIPQTVRRAVQALVRVVQFLVRALIYLVIVVLPTLLFLALIAAGVFFPIRALVRRAFPRRRPS